MDGSSIPQEQQHETVGEVRLYLPDGSVVLNDGRVVKPVRAEQAAVSTVREIQSGRNAAKTLERVSRKLGDLPADTKQLNAIAAVMMYSHVGLSNDDIAIALGTTVDNISKLKDMDAYQQLSAMFDESVFEDARRTATHIISGASAKAAERMVTAIDDGDSSVAVVASREVMKIAGIGADNLAPKKIGGLNIVIKRKGEHSQEDISIEVRP